MGKGMNHRKNKERLKKEITKQTKKRLVKG